MPAAPSHESIAVVIPVYNEAANIGHLLDEIDQCYDIFVVDDGSSDGGGEIARAHGAFVLTHHVNLGQGHAVSTGMKAALSGGYRIIVQMDGDGQHDPGYLPQMIRALDEKGVDVVIGSRMLGVGQATTPRIRRFFLPLFTWIVNRCTGYSLTDAFCGFRAFRAERLAEHPELYEHMVEPQYTAAERFIRYARAGFRVKEVPVPLRPRRTGRSKKGLITYGVGVLKALVRTLLEGWIL